MFAARQCTRRLLAALDHRRGGLLDHAVRGRSRGGGGRLAAAGHATRTVRRGLRATRGTHDGETVLIETSDDHGDVARTLADTTGATTSTRRETLHGRALVGVGGRDEELVGLEAVVVHGVRDGAVQHLHDGVGGFTLGARENVARVSHVFSTDEVENDAGLGGRHRVVLDLGASARTFVGLGSGH